ncbi:MAG: hypothetical protein K0R76_920 [Alphaproteobacteria bacterium]|jgi:membrane-associated phospholipid phosphatase|nr:hypothetical protein [Alphaproteobacteria bacterium]
MESIFSLLAKAFLIFSQGIVITPLLIAGFVTQGGFLINKSSSGGLQIWGNACLLVLFTMIFNVLLKSLFLVPLDPALRIKGFAFPSGHMQTSVALYGWLFLAYPNQVLRKALLFILAGIGYGLIHQGYHTLADVAGAVVFGIGTLYAFSKTAQFPSLQKNPARFGLYVVPLAALMMGGIYARTGVSPHIETTFMGLVGFSLLWWGRIRIPLSDKET